MSTPTPLTCEAWAARQRGERLRGMARVARVARVTLARAAAAWRRWRAQQQALAAERAALRQLLEMDEWTLRDMGLSRADVWTLRPRGLLEDMALDAATWARSLTPPRRGGQ